MKSFEEIFEIAATRHGGTGALLNTLTPPKSPEEIADIGDDRWLAGMTKCIFRAGFNWKVVENMWPGFEAAFEEFDIGRCTMMNDEDIDRLASDKRIVRHGPKIRSVRDNAIFLRDQSAEHGGAGTFFAGWAKTDYVGLLELLKKKGSRLGGTTGQYFLRTMGVDSFILSRDVTARLIAEGVVDQEPRSKTAMTAVQTAFNMWAEQSGKSLTEISQTLAKSID